VTGTLPVVVVIDDHAAAISHYRASARELPVELHAFRSPEEALGYLRENRPAVIVLDIVVPGHDGLALLKELRGLPTQEHTPIVVVTSKHYAQDRAAARELGAVEFYLKPLRPREIRTLIARYVGIGTDDPPR
jgi:CheY-like chemotaxis protein